MTLIYVAIGGALGAVLRYLTGLAVVFPYGTLTVNVVGSFIMGLMLVWLVETSPAGFHRWQPLIMTGLLGGFTTFSAFSLDALRLFETGRVAAAGAYVLGSVGLSLLAVVAGVLLARAGTA